MVQGQPHLQAGGALWGLCDCSAEEVEAVRTGNNGTCDGGYLYKIFGNRDGCIYTQTEYAGDGMDEEAEGATSGKVT